MDYKQEVSARKLLRPHRMSQGRKHHQGAPTQARKVGDLTHIYSRLCHFTTGLTFPHSWNVHAVPETLQGLFFITIQHKVVDTSPDSSTLKFLHSKSLRILLGSFLLILAKTGDK